MPKLETWRADWWLPRVKDGVGTGGGGGGVKKGGISVVLAKVGARIASCFL